MRGRAVLVAAALAAGLLCGCDGSVQRRRLAICSRTVPALTASEGDARILRAGSGPTPNSVRVDYAVGSRPHSVVCRFDSGAALSGIATDGAPLTGASLYLLRHYYLDAPDAVVDPGER